MNRSKVKIGLVGSGKTGSEVLHLAKRNPLIELEVFNSERPIQKNLDVVQSCRVLIVFVNSIIGKEILPLLIQIDKDIIFASTGLKFHQEDLNAIAKKSSRWIVSSNFSTGVFIFKQLTKVMQKYKDLVPESKFEIQETHHITKVDSPSGTAKDILDWLSQKDIPIESIRKEEVFGNHKLTLKNKTQSILVEHDATHRSIFAEGALQAAMKLGLPDGCFSNLPPGLYQYYDLLERNFT
mgnify:CR=1 FL=1